MSQVSKVETLRLFRASPIGDRGVPQVTIEIHNEMPDRPGSLDLGELHRRYTREGEALAKALFQSLPGGTIDALLGAMLQRRASLFRVPFVTNKERG